MPLPLAFLAQQTSDTAGSGTLTLNAASAMRRSFAAATGSVAACVEYRISLGSTEYELGIGIFNGASPGTLTRVAVQANHLGTTGLVTFSAGTKDVQLLSLPGQVGVVGFTGATTAALVHLGSLYNFTGSSPTTLTLPAAATVPLGAGYKVRHAGGAVALTIDGNGSELVGAAATLVLMPGETVEIWATATGWLASGLPALALIGSATPTNGSNELIFGLPVTNAVYEVTFHSSNFNADAQLLLQTSTDSGATFNAGAGDYNANFDFVTAAGSVSNGATTGSALPLTTTADSAGAAGGWFQFHSGSASRPFRIHAGRSNYAAPTDPLQLGGTFGGGRVVNGAVDAIKFTTGGSTFTSSGVYSLYLRRA